MFQSGDFVVLKDGYHSVFEVASHHEGFGCDLWNEDEYLIGINSSNIRHATLLERVVGHRVKEKDEENLILAM